MLQIATCLFVMLCIARGKLLQSPKDTEAVVGENVTLRCRTDINDSTYPVEWRYRSTPSSSFKIVYKKTRTFNERHEVVPNTVTGQYDLVIKNVQLSDAGRYTCADRDDMPNHPAELIVFGKNPSHEFCATTSTSNDNQNGCESGSLTISCDLSYQGNQNLTLEWLEGDNTILSTVRNNADGSITSSIQLQKSQLKTAKITCRVLYPASMTTSRFTWSPPVNITPMENASSLSIGGCGLQTVECSDAKNPHCQYTWKDENGTEVSSSSSMEMADKPNGNYTCFATCIVHQASCSHVAKLFIYSCDDSNSQSTSATSSTSLENIAPPESQGITSPGMYIGLPVASVIAIVAVILLVALLLFRRSFFVCNGTTRGNHAINDAECGRTHNSNHIDMTPLNGTISEGPTEKDVMLTDTHWPRNNDVPNISEIPERNRGFTETSDGVS